jgi:hypothetical protein
MRKSSLQSGKNTLQENRDAMSTGIRDRGLSELLPRNVGRSASLGLVCRRCGRRIDRRLDRAREIGRLGGKGSDEGLERVDHRPRGRAR